YELAELVSNEATVEKLMESPTINVRIDAIITTKKGSKLNGEVKEDGQGGLIEDGKIYHLKEDSEWKELMGIFAGHTFSSYREIKEYLENYTLTLDYNVVGTKEDNIGCTSTVSAGNGYTVSKDYLYYNGKEVLDTYRVLQQFYLPDVGEYGIDLYKQGYHLPENNEWKTEDGRTFSDSELLMPKKIEPSVGFKNKMVTLYANWQPNEYYVVYRPAGGSGTVPTSTFYYDNTDTEYLAENTFYRNGYTLPKGKEWIDAEGNTYASGAAVHNLTSEHKKEIVLYANWQPVVVLIQTDKQGGIGGTDFFYQKYGIGNFSDENCINSISVIRLPSYTGYRFMGYFTGTNGNGDEIVGTGGAIANTYFFKDTTIYAYWEPEVYKITLDNQGADIRTGTDAFYEKYGIGNFSDANCTTSIANIIIPEKTGYAFGGYFTGINGTGTAAVGTTGKIVSDAKTFTSNTTLYAYWIPKVYEITLDMQGGSGGTEYFFEKYGVGFYSDRDCTNAITSITVPVKTGNNFKGYWTNPRNEGTVVISYGGTGTTTTINLSAKTFTSNTTLYAHWDEVIYTITFDKQGGTGGTSSATVAYGAAYPMASAPNRGTYTFYGYYTGKNGSGTLIYDKYMNTSQKYTLTTNQTLYAYWLDESAPIVNLLVDYDTWTNKPVTLTANAQDFASGLSKVEIYLLYDDGSISSSPVASATNLNGVNEYQITYVNQTEGIIRYKAIATDVQGHISESINVVYYDITPPSGELISGGKNGNTFEFEFDITDINPGN
ncbi:MAG: InlB B-repeat-containing protein, partial [Agathobacter sp.]